MNESSKKARKRIKKKLQVITMRAPTFVHQRKVSNAFLFSIKKRMKREKKKKNQDMFSIKKINCRIDFTSFMCEISFCVYLSS